MKRTLKRVKTKQNPQPREGKALRSPLYFSEGRWKTREKNVASTGPPHVTAEDVDCTSPGSINRTSAQPCVARLTQAHKEVRSMGRLVGSHKVGSKGQLGFQRTKKGEQECRLHKSH